MSAHFDIIKRELVFEGRVFTIVRDEVRHGSGYESVREVVQHIGGAAVVALFDDGDTLLVRQYRYPMQRTVLELPAGKLDAGEDPALCAARELEEETGWRADTVVKLTEMMSTPGFCSEVLHIYLATGLTPGVQQLEQGEESIEVVRLPLREALLLCRSGDIADGKSITGLALAAMHTGLVQLSAEGG